MLSEGLPRAVGCERVRLKRIFRKRTGTLHNCGKIVAFSQSSGHRWTWAIDETDCRGQWVDGGSPGYKITKGSLQLGCYPGSSKQPREILLNNNVRTGALGAVSNDPAP